MIEGKLSKAFADIRASRNHGDLLRRKIARYDFGEERCGFRNEFRGLEKRSISRGKRIGQRGDGKAEGEIPGGDDSDHTLWKAADLTSTS